MQSVNLTNRPQVNSWTQNVYITAFIEKNKHTDVKALVRALTDMVAANNTQFTSDRLLIIYNASIIKQKSQTQKLKIQLITAYFKSTQISSLEESSKVRRRWKIVWCGRQAIPTLYNTIWEKVFMGYSTNTRARIGTVYCTTVYTVAHAATPRPVTTSVCITLRNSKSRKHYTQTSPRYTFASRRLIEMRTFVPDWHQRRGIRAGRCSWVATVTTTTDIAPVLELETSVVD